jgi:hypothetical protein
MGVVQADPYRLAELDGVNFAHVDTRIRQHYGIGDEDMRRIKAAVVHSLRRLTDGGSTVVTWQELFAHACGSLGGYADLVVEATSELFKAGALKAFEKTETSESCIALASDFKAESDIWEYVNK